jgi:hypothetical protein
MRIQIGIRNLFDPGSRMEKLGSGINIPDPQQILHGINRIWYNAIVGSHAEGLQYLEEKEMNELVNLQEHERHREQVILIS